MVQGSSSPVALVDLAIACLCLPLSWPSPPTSWPFSSVPFWDNQSSVKQPNKTSKQIVLLPFLGYSCCFPQLVTDSIFPLVFFCPPQATFCLQDFVMLHTAPAYCRTVLQALLPAHSELPFLLVSLCQTLPRETLPTSSLMGSPLLSTPLHSCSHLWSPSTGPWVITIKCPYSIRFSWGMIATRSHARLSPACLRDPASLWQLGYLKRHMILFPIFWLVDLCNCATRNWSCSWYKGLNRKE